MYRGVCSVSGRGTFARGVLAMGFFLLALTAPAEAQNTVVLNAHGTEVTDTTIRNGVGADRNYNDGVLLTRASDDPDWERRALLKFDTENTIPKNTTISSAILTLTVRSGLGSDGATRRVRAFRLTQAFQEAEATWNRRQGSSYWKTPGGDVAEAWATANVTNIPGSKVSFDVTALVQQTVNGGFDSRYTRIALVDVDYPVADPDSKVSYREYYASEASSSSQRPQLILTLGGASSSQAVVLNAPGAQVADAMIRNGSYVTTNSDNGVLLTRTSDDPEWQRRTLLDFDTESSVPARSVISSARLTLTVRAGLGSAGGTTPVRAYRINTSFNEGETTWLLRKSYEAWSAPGGDLGAEYSAANVTNVPGEQVSFDVTALVQRTVNGDYGSRRTRLALIAVGPSSYPAGKDSYREYYSSEDPDPSRRPALTIVYEEATTPPPPPPSPSTTLRVLQWNIAQGYGTDGKSNIDRVVSWIVKMKPDLISFNEIMKYSSSSQPQIIADKLKAQTGQSWTYHWIQKTGASSGEGEAVFSRFPISGTNGFLLSYDRSAALATVTVNGRLINMVSTHLDHQYSSRRLAQVKELKAWVANFPEQRIVAGDFNWYPGTAEINEMTEDYKDGWAVAKSQGTAVAHADNPDGNTRNTRIDYVFSSKGASALTVTGAQVFDTRDASGHRPSDHNPLVVTYEVR